MAQTKLTISDIYNSAKFRPKGFDGGRWSNGGGAVVNYIEETGIVAFNLESNQKTTILETANLTAPDTQKKIAVEEYEFSTDNKKVLLYTESKPVWRTNSKGYYYIVDVASKTVKALSNRNKGYQMFAKFSPDSKKAAFVRNRNLFVVDLATMRETQLTMDGKEGSIINGTFDWVYEEEFGLRDGWRWSPDSKQISFWKLDESKEENFTMMDLLGHYPKATTFRYPKAGTPNAEVQIGLIDVATKRTRYFNTDTWNTGGDTHEYIASMGWTPPINGKSQVWMFRLNRDQNNLDVLYGDATTMQVKTVLNERNNTWVEVETEPWVKVGNGKLVFLSDNQHFVWQSDQDGWKHLYLYKNDGTKIRQLTKGNWEVANFHGVDEKNGIAYITATKEGPAERHLYKVKMDGSSELTRLTQESGTHSSSLSDDFRYFIDSYSDIVTPSIVKLKKNDGSTIKVLENNEALINTLKGYELARPEFSTIPAADGSTKLPVMITKPRNFDASKKYPVLMHVYGGPGSQQVVNSWKGANQLWHQYLANELGVIVVIVDNRGTGALGKDFLSRHTYKKLLQTEAIDQVAGAKWVSQQSWADANRIGIWGWSYGGSMTLMSMLTDGGDIFKMGLSVAPVTDWKQYDTIYTERYMSTPQKNKSGYDMNPLTLAKNLKAHQKLLLVHGDGDDNVHFQNSAQMVAALQTNLKQFDFMMYPNKNHAIAGGTTRLQLFTMLTNYVIKNL